jgi:hypothetical protein
MHMNCLTTGTAVAVIVLASVCWDDRAAVAQDQPPPGRATATATGVGPLTPMVDDMLSAAGTRKGLCFMPGCRSGELAVEIASRSDLFVHALVSDEAKLDLVRGTLEATGAYSRRVAAERGSLLRLPYPDYGASRPRDPARCVIIGARRTRIRRPSPQPTANLARRAISVGCSWATDCTLGVN